MNRDNFKSGKFETSLSTVQKLLFMKVILLPMMLPYRRLPLVCGWCRKVQRNFSSASTTEDKHNGITVDLGSVQSISTEEFRSTLLGCNKDHPFLPFYTVRWDFQYSSVWKILCLNYHKCTFGFLFYINNRLDSVLLEFLENSGLANCFMKWLI
jgi:hypothetical protein